MRRITFDVTGSTRAVVEANALVILGRYFDADLPPSLTWDIDVRPLTRNMGEEAPSLWTGDVTATWAE